MDFRLTASFFLFIAALWSAMSMKQSNKAEIQKPIQTKNDVPVTTTQIVELVAIEQTNMAFQVEENRLFQQVRGTVTSATVMEWDPRQ